MHRGYKFAELNSNHGIAISDLLLTAHSTIFFGHKSRDVGEREGLLF